jgi:hypothetical protein
MPSKSKFFVGFSAGGFSKSFSRKLVIWVNYKDCGGNDLRKSGFSFSLQ